jgi:periplasmic copper chaperone A
MRQRIVSTMALAICVACGGGKAPDLSGAPHMRPAEQGASSAVYFTFRNPGPDTLVLRGAEVDVAGATTLHRSMDHQGMSSMMAVDTILIAPGDSVMFAERGLHIMATDLHAPLRLGDTISVRLLFRSSRVDTLRVPVRE